MKKEAGKNYEIGIGNYVCESNLTKQEAQKLARDLWKEDKTMVYWRKMGTTKWHV